MDNEFEGVKITEKAYASNPGGQVFVTEDIFADPIKWIELFGDAREEALEELDALEKEE